ncbi:MAG TPA: response regulator [Thermoanaerobaculia bacterium]|nr:response regulator [Thermoanaerobaculia bacterium]
MSEKPVILVIDDDVPIQILMQSLLREFGFDPVVAGSGEKALEVIRGGVRPDLVLLDLNMPGMSGADAMHALHAVLDGQVPIVILSGDRLDPDELVKLGAAGGVQKPFDVVELVTRIRNFVGAASK